MYNRSKRLVYIKGAFNLFGLLLLISLVVSIVYLCLTLSAVKRNRTKIKSRAIVTVGAILVFIISIMGLDRMPDPKTDAQTAVATKNVNNDVQKDVEVVSEKENVPSLSIGITPDNFIKSFNKESKRINAGLEIKNSDIVEHKVKDTFNYQLTDYIYLIGEVNKENGELWDVGILGSTDGTSDSAAELLVAAGLLFSSVQPGAEVSDGGEILNKLGFFEKDSDLTNINNSIVKNGLLYSVLHKQDIGVMFHVASAKKTIK